MVSCNVQYLFELHLTNSRNSYQLLYLAIFLHIQSNITMEKVRNWDREVHQKETHSMSGFEYKYVIYFISVSIFFQDVLEQLSFHQLDELHLQTCQ